MKTVIVGLSGGVDSSVTAYLLKQQGYEVIGLHMKVENQETQEEDENRVRALCEKLNIRCEIVDYKDQMQIVKDYFINEYLNGRTPNPCVVCNKEVKFKPFLEFVKKFEADYFATGHYAVVEHNENNHTLKKAKDTQKDQSYFLCKLSNEQLSKVLFPLGNLTKQEVKQIAKENNLVDETTKESYDVCFLGSQKFKDYMNKFHPEKPGDIIDIQTNKKVGTHTGISKYTVGQRKGLNIGGLKGYDLSRWFVVKKDVLQNKLYVSCGESENMFSNKIKVTDFNFINKAEEKEFNCNVKLRYRQPDQQTKVEIIDDKTLELTFKEKQKSVSIGQFAVLYKEDGTCLGGGTISEIIK